MVKKKSHKEKTKKKSKKFSEKSKMMICDWFINGETGVSSKAIASLFLEVRNTDMCHPWDPADFGRCVKLLRWVPEIREHMDKIAKISPPWRNMVLF